jgi:hypothetical protein
MIPFSQTCGHPDAKSEQELIKSNKMKTLNTNYLLGAGVAMAMAMTICLPVTITAADEPMKPMKGGEHQEMMLKGEDAKGTPGKMMMDGKMMQGCQAMMDQKQKMAEDMKAQDAQLTKELADMNSASDDKKTALMATVITHMVEQRIAMNAQMATMHDKMMQHMMQHMQMGKESMMQCPMMKGMSGMKDMDKTSADTQTKPEEEQK